MKHSCTVVPVVLAVLLSGCPKLEPEPGAKKRRALTANFADEIALPRLADLVAGTVSLREAITTLADVGGVDPETAQQAWRDSALTWQQLEMLHLGPAGSPASFVMGQGLRDRISAWPVINLCAVDAQILAGAFEDDGWIEARLANVIGLGAVEYALFAPPDNACPATAAMNVDGTWAALGAAEVASRRARYAAVLAQDIVLQAEALRGAWVDGGFAATLRTAGEEGSSFPSAQQALDEIYAALFQVELGTKDLRLGIPSGLNAACPTATCPERLESPYARHSKENVMANLEVTRRVFLGLDQKDGNQTGFDDLLVDAGAGELRDTMAGNLDGAIASARNFEGSFEDALATEPARVQAVYEAVKAFTDDFKSTFASTLGLRVPDEGAGDND